MAERYDVIVIGGGPSGENVADRVARGGLSCLLIERELLGGECSYWACMPSKTLLRPGDAVRAAKRVPGARAAVTGKIDVRQTLAWRDYMVSGFDDSSQVKWLEDSGVNLARGQGRLDGERRVVVADGNGRHCEYEATKAVVIATGSDPAMPPVPGLKGVATWDNRDITSLKDPPGRLLVLGGGAVGVEMAQAWNDLGADEVTVVETAGRLLSREEPFAGELVEKAFTGTYGINVMTGTKLESARRDGDEVVSSLSVGSELRTDHVLIATGRRPRTSGLGLDSVGLEPGKAVPVDGQLRAIGVEGEWLYAVGDANGRSMLTHNGKYQARIAADVILGKKAEAWGDMAASPRVIFTDPNVAAVGLTEAQAREKGINTRSVDFGFGDVAGASVTGEGIEGNCRWVVDEDSKTLVGVTFVGPGASEMLHAATIAVAGRVSLDTLWHAVPAFPTISEVWLRFLETYGY